MIMSVDVFDFNSAVAEFISVGLRKYIEENKKAIFPTAPMPPILYVSTEESSLEERMTEWHTIIENLANKFDALSKEYHPRQEDMDVAFDELKRVYAYLWI